MLRRGFGLFLLLALALGLLPAVQAANDEEPAPLGSPMAVNGTLTVTGNYNNFGGNFIYPGMSLTIVVVDADLNVNFGPGNDNYTTATSELLWNRDSGAATGRIPMNEDLSTPGRFTATVDFTQAPYNGLIGSNFLLTFNDLLKATPAAANPTFSFNIIATNATIAVTPTSGVVGSTFTITVNDADRNRTNGGSNDSISVVVRNFTDDPGGATQRTFTATETGTPGVFSLALNNLPAGAIASPTNWDAAIGNTGAGDFLRVFYFDDFRSVAGPGVWINTNPDYRLTGTNASILIDPVPSVSPGGNVLITLTDPDLNTSPTTAQGVSVVLFGTDGITNVSVGLTETGPNTGIFNATYNLSTAPLTPKTVGGNIFARYNDQFNTTGAPVNRDSNTTRIASTTGVLTVPATYTIGATTPLLLRVTDPDANISNANNTVTVVMRRVTNCVASCTANVILTETGSVTGIFENNTYTPDFATLAATWNAFTTPVVAGDIFEFTYADAANASNVAENIRVSTTIIGTQAVLTVPATYTIGTISALTVRVTDADMNTSGAAQTVNVTMTRVTNCTGACTSNLTLTETGGTTGIFENSTYTPNFATMKAIWDGFSAVLKDGDEFEFTYIDTTNTSGAPVTYRARTRIVGLADSVLTATPNPMNLGGTFTVTVTDADTNSPAGPNNNTVPISFFNVTKNTPVFNFNLPEVTTGTGGVYTAGFDSTRALYALNLSLGDRIRVTYIDTVNSTGAAITRTAEILVGNVGGGASLTATNTIPGRLIEVNLTDPDLTSAAFPEVTITARNQRTGELEDVKLLPISEGVYRGTLATAEPIAPDTTKDGTMEVLPGDVVRFTYRDQANATGLPRDITADSNVIDRRTVVAFCDRGMNTTAPQWRGEYFNNKTLGGDPVARTTETHLSLNWEETAPYRPVPADGWSARWTTSILVQQAGKYKFRLGADDGVRFYVNDRLVLDQFSNGSFRTFFVDVALQPGQNSFRVEYFEDTQSSGLLVDCQYGEAPVAAIDTDGNTVDVFPSDVNLNEATAHITTGRINVRANPTITAARIDYVFIYERYPIIGVTTDNAWYLIQLEDGRTGWVAAIYVRRYEENPVQIYPTFSGSETTLPNVQVTGFAKVELNIRNGVRGDVVISILPAGATFPILARSGSGAWIKISYDGIEGWVQNLPEYIGFTNGTINDLPREG
jgi:SH3-like domain-containing protein